MYVHTYILFTYLRTLSVCAEYVSQVKFHTYCTCVPYSFLSSLENTKWLLYISQLLSVSLEVVATLDKEELPVLVHCSDGWDRTPQVVALAKIILDPHYRTIEVR